jgi:hypothetical protein
MLHETFDPSLLRATELLALHPLLPLVGMLVAVIL